MTRVEQAIAFAKSECIKQNPEMADKAFRESLWKKTTPLNKQIFLMQMSQIAEFDLQREERIYAV